MKRICLCVSTYKRPRQLGWLIAMFLRQTYPNKYMVILDDAGQIKPQEGENWRIYSTATRYPSLADKRNATFALAPDDCEWVGPADDDDFYMPWHLEIGAAALARAQWSVPSRVLYRDDFRSFRQHLTGPGKFYHAGMLWHREVFERVGGYPSGFSGPEDAQLFRRMEAIQATVTDPLEPGHGLSFNPSYVYGTNDGLLHISAHLKPNDSGADAYALCGQQECEKSELVIEPPPGVELDNPIIMPGVLPRPF